MSDPRTVSLISIAANDIPVEFPEAAAREAEQAKAAPLGDRARPAQRSAGHHRWRATRATSTTRCSPSPTRPHPGGWHAAWSPSPTSPGTCARQAARPRRATRRGNSVYFPDRVVPMLPEALSNDLCSLMPRRATGLLVADLWIDDEGQLKRHRFHRALMRSAARLTYSASSAAIDGHPDEETGALLEPVLKPLYGAYRAARSRAREARRPRSRPARAPGQCWATTAASPDRCRANASTATS